GASAGQYGLTINNGGNFIVYGSTRTPSTTATADAAAAATSISVNTPITGWAYGDVITVDTEAVTITSIAGNTVNFTPGLGHIHYSSMPVIVADLSRNAVVRSSGTNTSTNTSYIQNLVKNATSFALTYGEFAYLGKSGCGAADCGITFNGSGTQGSVSSSTVRNGYDGIFLNGSSKNTLTGNNAYANGNYGLHLDGSSNNALTSNNVYSNSNNG